MRPETVGMKMTSALPKIVSAHIRREGSILKRVPTGISGLDPLIDGGVPARSLILIAGAPGTGKTALCWKFLEAGAQRYDEKGMYVSLLESKETLMANLFSQFGPNSSDSVERGMIEVLTFPAMKSEGLSTMMDSVMARIQKNDVKRLVIDSVTAISQSFQNELESRMFVHTLLTKIISSYGCTTFITKEIPSSRPRIGGSVEDFVSDGVFLLRKLTVKGRTMRELWLAKLRGTRFETSAVPFTLEKGFAVFPPSSYTTLQWIGRLEPIPDSDNYFSTGNRRLDHVLGGGYLKGTLVLLEAGEDIPLNAYGILSYPTIANFLNNGSPTVGIQSLGADPSRTYERWKITSGENAKYGRSVERLRATGDEKPYMVYLKSEKPEDTITEYLQIGAELRKETGKPVIWWVSLDHFVDLFGADHAEKALSELSVNVIHNKELAVVLSKPGLERFTRCTSNIAGTHLRLFNEHGSVLLYGVKPRTPLYAVAVDTEKGLNSTNFFTII